MKVLWFLFRVGLIFLITLVTSYSLAVIFFNYPSYQTSIDRAFLVLVPALAITYLLFQIPTTFWNWLRQREFKILVKFSLLAVIGATAIILPIAIFPVYYLAIIGLAIVLFTLMLPATPSIERMGINHSLWHYTFGFLLSFLFAYGAVGFLSDVLKTTLNMIVFTVILILAGSSLGYLLVRRAVCSFHGGFLSKPLNIILAFALPLFLVALIYASAQFPSMFVMDYIRVPQNWLGMFIASALVAGTWGVIVLEKFETRGYAEKLKQSIIFKFANENLPGIYAGSMFFLIHLIITRALNHDALNINTVLFESDAGPWMSILGSPEGDAVNRSVHPLILLTIRPLMRFVALFTADQWNLAVMIVVAALSGLCVLMAWLFVKRATGHRSYSFIFAILLGSTAAHLFFGSIPDTYVFGMTSLIFFFLLVQAKENRFSVLVPAGLLVFGLTITNIVQGVIGLFFNKFGFWRLVRYCIFIICAGIVLTVFTSMLYPGRQTFFFVPADIAFENHFVKPVYEDPGERLLERFKILSRTMFAYEVVGPRPIEVIAHKPPRPTIDLKTFDPSNYMYASYKGIAKVPLVFWLVLLIGSFLFFVRGLRSSPHLPLMLGLLGSLAFNFLLHMNYGTELFLYTAFWTYSLIFFIALAYAELAGKKWFESILTIFVLMLMINNAWFIFVILRGLAPFYASTS